jgi:hypothetical protein
MEVTVNILDGHFHHSTYIIVSDVETSSTTTVFEKSLKIGKNGENEKN